MHILYLHQYFVTPESSGGTRSYEFARRLVGRGHKVTLITSQAMLSEAWRTSGSTLRRPLEGIDVVVIQVPYSNHMAFSERIQAFLKFAGWAGWEVMKHPGDLIFATSTPLTIALPGLLGSLFHRIPLVFEVRDLWPSLPIAIGALKNPLLRRAAQALEWMAYQGAEHVVALSEGMAEGVRRRGIPQERVTVIPNGADLQVFGVSKEVGRAFRERHLPWLKEHQPLVVYAGTFGIINGVGWMVELAAAMASRAPEVRFLMVGGGVEGEKVLALAREKGVLEKNLWILPSLSKGEMPGLMSAATLCSSWVIPQPAFWNNSANKFFDALAAGRPVAINHEGWQADLLRETGAGVVLPQSDPRQGALILADFLEDESRVREAGRQARLLAETRFDRDLLANQFMDLLEAVEKRKGRGRRPDEEKG